MQYNSRVQFLCIAFMWSVAQAVAHQPQRGAASAAISTPDSDSSPTAVWYVPDDYATIQAAVDGASYGDTIMVRAGTYYEHVTIDKHLTLQGADAATTILDGGGSGTVLTVLAGSVTVAQLTIQNSGSGTQDAAITLEHPVYCTIENCVLTASYIGLLCDGSSYNTITCCTIAGNARGILAQCDLFASRANQIIDNTIESNRLSGIRFAHGVEHSQNLIRGNNIGANGTGIYMIVAYENEICYNAIAENTGYGLYLDACACGTSDNIIHHNNFYANNGGEAQGFQAAGSGPQYWYSATDGIGNFWSDYAGVDTDHDGIGQAFYAIPDAGAADPYPLMHPCVPGDMNLDGVLNGYDIDPFVLALTDPSGYRAQYQVLATLHGDVNRDGALDGFDIDPFVYGLTHYEPWSPPANRAPLMPANPVPADGASDVSTLTDLAWMGGDPDPEDAVTYDIYLEIGDDTPEVVISEAQTPTTFDPGALAGSSTYYWQIVAHDNHGAVTVGPVWHFTTSSRQWLIGVVDDTGPSGTVRTAIALDSLNRPHIAYKDLAAGDLRYALLNGGSWAIQVVDSVGDVGTSPAIALDSFGRPQISYYDGTNHDLKCALWNGTAWDIDVVDSAGSVGSSSSIAVDTFQRPHISYFDYTNRDLKYAYFTGSAWVVETVDAEGDMGADSSLALDTDGRPHISYSDDGFYQVRYAAWTGASWELQTLAPGHDPSLALDSQDHPHLVFTDGRIKYAEWTGTEWQIETVDPDTTDTFAGPTVALDSTGRPHAAYCKATSADLKYAVRDASTWLIEMVDSGISVGRGASIAVDAFDEPHISYHDYYNSAVKYARCLETK